MSQLTEDVTLIPVTGLVHQRVPCDAVRIRDEYRAQQILTGDFNAKITINKENCQHEASRNGKLLQKLIKDTSTVCVTTNQDEEIWTCVKRKKSGRETRHRLHTNNRTNRTKNPTGQCRPTWAIPPKRKRRK